MAHMANTAATDHKAGAGEVHARAPEIRRLAADLGLPAPRLRDDGTVIIHATDAGYRTANHFSSAMSHIVGTYVHVITDDVRGAASARDL